MSRYASAATAAPEEGSSSAAPHRAAPLDGPGGTNQEQQYVEVNPPALTLTLTLTLDLSPTPTRTLSLTLTQPLTLTRCSLVTAPALSSAREARLRHSAT